jgi:cell wall-associated NlpC family hydrolase
LTTLAADPYAPGLFPDTLPSRPRRRLGWAAAAIAVLLLAAMAAFELLMVIADIGGTGGSNDGCISGVAAPPPPGAPTSADAMTAEQRTNANLIVAAGRSMGVPDRGLWIALATALQESGLRNLPSGDRDSLGLFQQRPSQGWGTAARILDPTHAAQDFFTHLLAVPGWQTMPLSAAAQAVQRSAFPGAYDQWQQTAADLLASAGGTPAICATTTPAASNAEAATAIQTAKTELGKPYVWGATGPGAFDCSGLTMTAWEAAGVTLPHTSAAQANAGPHIPLDQAQPADLLFWSYDGTVSGVHHVALYLGGGEIIEAPETGIPVRIRAVRFPAAGKPAEAGLLPYAIRPGSNPANTTAAASASGAVAHTNPPTA